MSTLTKSESSRINGAKSRGPVTPEGKKRSSTNAVKHGILAKHICLNIEKPEVFEELVADFCTRFQPADNVELRLVEQAAMAQFRYERMAASTETSMFVLKMDEQAPEVAKQYERVDAPTRFAIAFTSLASEGNSIQLMLRYQQTMLRQRDSALKQLHELRAKFPPPSEPESPQRIESKGQLGISDETSRSRGGNDERTTTNDEHLSGAKCPTPDQTVHLPEP